MNPEGILVLLFLAATVVVVSMIVGREFLKGNRRRRLHGQIVPKPPNLYGRPCDMCGAKIKSDGKVYPAQEIHSLVKRGCRPSIHQMKDRVFEAEWLNAVPNKTTDWSVCNNCCKAIDAFKAREERERAQVVAEELLKHPNMVEELVSAILAQLRSVEYAGSDAAGAPFARKAASMMETITPLQFQAQRLRFSLPIRRGTARTTQELMAWDAAERMKPDLRSAARNASDAVAKWFADYSARHKQ